jgi:hypothetical protein
MPDMDRLATDVFDFFSKMYSRIFSSDKPAYPDVSGIDISHLINETHLASPEALYEASDAVPEINFKCKARLPFLEIWDGAYESPVKTRFPQSDTVYVRHYRVKPRRRGRPVVLMINGLHLEDDTYFDWWCWRFAAWGLDSMLVMMPFSQKRQPENSYSGEYIIAPDTAWTMLSLRHSFLDIQLAANWLRQAGCGDIGTFGASFGALMSGIFACQYKHAGFCILGMPPMDITEILQQWSFADHLREREAAGETTILTDPRVPPLFNMSRMMPKMPREKIFIAKGLYDHLVTPESIDRTAERWGGLPWLREYPTGHINTFVLNLRFVRDVKEFIKKEIV